MKLAASICLSAVAVLVAGCASTAVSDSTELDGPVSGPADATNFVAGTDGGGVGLGEVARVAKTIRKYKDLGAQDQEIVRRVAALKFDGMVASQMQRLAPAYERKKSAARQKTQVRVAAARREAASGRTPAAVAQSEVAAAEADQAKELAALDAQWESAARAAVVKSHGTDFALPVQNPDGKAVVAFASVREAGISVSAAAYEVGVTPQSLADSASAGRDLSHQGRVYALLDAEVTLR